MANVGVVFSASIVDGLGRRKTTEAYGNLVDTTTLATLAAAQGTWLSDLDAITDGAIVDNRVLIRPAPPGGLKTVGTGATFMASRVAQTGVFRFSATGSSHSWSSDVPSLSNATIAGDSINPANAGVIAYVALLDGGAYTNPENQTLLALEATKITYRHAKP